MGWFYDFDSFKTLSDDGFENVKALRGQHTFDNSGLGIRLWVDKFQCEAPMLLSDIKAILFNSNQIAMLPEVVTNGSIGHYSVKLGKKHSRNTLFNKHSLAREQQIRAIDAIPKSPRDVVNLTKNPCQGDDVKVAVIDSSFNLTPTQLGEYQKRIINFSQNPLSEKESHGSKVMSIIAGADFSIAPKAKLFIARATRSLGCLVVALLWAAKQRVDIINVSKVIGQSDALTGVPELLQRAVDFCTAKNCLIVAASSDFSDGPCSALALISQVVSVNSMNSANSLIFSVVNAGQFSKIDCVTWGNNIMSLNDFSSGNVSLFNNASAATPIVAASLAIFKQMHPNFICMQDLKNYFFAELCSAHSTGGKLWGHGVVSFK